MSFRPLEGFLAVRSEGGLLPADLLQRIVAGSKEVEGLDPQRDYHLAGGELLNEAVSRSWQRLLGAWRNFRAAASFLEPGDPATTLTRERWLLILFQELGYGRLSTSKAISIDGREYPISHLWQRVPIHLVGCQVEIDKRTPGVAGAARTTPHGLLQDFLNRSQDHVWGVVSNGLRLRLLRDNARLTRQAYVEFDLESIFENELYADFGLLWLLCHESRLEQERPEAYWLERWRETAAKQGARALDTLRDGVEAALLVLGSGFLAHPANAALKASLHTGSLSTQEFYRDLLRLVYRLMFLFVAEDRDVLHAPGAQITARQRYLSHYSSRRLRDLSRRMRGTGHSDLFRTFKVVAAGLSGADGCPPLGLPALGGLLWSTQAAPHLDRGELANRDWLEAVRALAYTRQDGVLRPVDWRNLGSTELGSVYESLLELHPDVNSDAAAFSLSSEAGNERKTSGSYYTPDSLVQCLLDTALDPVLAEAAAKSDPEQAILALKVCDPACGSGHFLIAAAHRIARRLAIERTGDDEPAPEASRASLRDVVGRCLYGVDLNPMAAELCKVSLWLEGLEPGRPLSFLDHHIRVGNSLLGTAPDLIAADIPDSAFEPIQGDDKKTCAALKKRNRLERDGQQDMLHLMVPEPSVEYSGLADQASALDGIDDTSVAGVAEKETRFQKLIESQKYRHAQLVANAWCAVFVWKKASDGKTPGCITTDAFRRLKADATALSQDEEAEVHKLADSYSLFHWHLAFPEVFAKGGFDCVLGNPPWEHTELKEKEWFAQRQPDIANARTGAERKRMIGALEAQDPTLYAAFVDALRGHSGASHFLGNSGRFPLCGRGRINLYAVFAEAMRGLVNERGRTGCVLPTGIATDDTTKFFFQDVIEKKSLASLFDFENKGIFFPGVHSSYKFCLFTAGRGPTAERAEFVFFAHAVEDLRDPERRFTLSAEDIGLLNPNTRTCPIFRSRRDAELTKAIYRRVPVLIREARDGRPEENPWGIRFKQGLFNMTSDSHLFRTRDQLDGDGWQLEGNVFRKAGVEYLPLYEQNLIHLDNHRFASFRLQDGRISHDTSENLTPARLYNANELVVPRFWVPSSEIAAVTQTMGFTGRFFLGFRRSVRSTDVRTALFCALPLYGIGDSIFVIVPPDHLPDALLANLGSFAFDFASRQSIGGENASFFIMKQLPTLPPFIYAKSCPWLHTMTTLRDWVLPRVLELTYTAWDLQPFAKGCGWSGSPFRWDDERRFLLRCELDAAFFHLYLGPEEEWRRQPETVTKDFPAPRHAVEHIMETFPIVKRKDDAAHGEYRTKRVILESYDEIQRAMDGRRPYQTRLDPPPADSRVAHGAPRAVAAPTGQTKLLPFRRLSRAPKRDERYETAVPLLTLKVAAGTFGETQDVEFDEWVELANPPQLKKGMFLAQVTGRSMEPEIPEGSYCLFRYVRPGSREGKVVLVQLHGHTDPESGGSYTVKRYHSEKQRDEDGGWRHARIILTPANPEYEPIVLGAKDEGEVKVVAELVKVL